MSDAPERLKPEHAAEELLRIFEANFGSVTGGQILSMITLYLRARDMAIDARYEAALREMWTVCAHVMPGDPDRGLADTLLPIVDRALEGGTQ